MVILAHDESIPALAYLPDGRRIVTGSYDGTVKVWNMDNGEQELEGAAMGHKSNISSLVVTRDGTKIVSGDDNGNIKVWNVESHVLVREWTQGRGYPIAISPDERLVAAGGASAIYTMEGRVVKDGIKLNEAVWSVAFSPDGEKLACGNWEGDIYVYDVDNGTPARGPLEGHQNTSAICCGHAMAGDSSLLRGTTRFAAGTPTRENKSDNRGQVTPTGYAPSPFHQPDRFLPAFPWIKLFVSGMQLLVIPSDNIYNTTIPSLLLVSLLLANSWHQQDGMGTYMCGRHLG